MTISTTISKVVLPGTGAQTSFAYPFLIPVLGDELVIYTDGNGLSTTLPESQYTITGIGSPTGGTVTYTISGAAIAIGTSLTIARNVPYVQNYSFNNQGYFLPSVIESALDYVTMAIQQVENSIGYGFTAPLTDSNPPLPLPSATARANQYAAFDSSGNMIAGLPVTSGAIVSSAMQPVVNAATTAAAVALLGINVSSGGYGIQTSKAVAATVDFGSVVTHNILLTGSGTITSFGSSASTSYPDYQFTVSATTTFTNSASLLCPGSVNLIGLVGDVGIAAYQGSGIWKIISYLPASGASPVPPVTTPSTGMPSASGLVIKNSSGSNTIVAITANYVQIPNASYTNIIRVNVSTTASTAFVGAGGLDAGVVAASTWYHVWLIDNGSTTSAVLSLSAAAPTLPSGYTYYMRVGAVYANPSKLLMQTLQQGNRAQYVIAASTTTIAYPRMITGASGNISAANGLTAIPIAAFAPPTAARINLQICDTGAGSGASTLAAPSNNFGPISSTTNLPPFTWYGSYYMSQSVDWVLESSNVYYASNGIYAYMSAMGWTDSVNAS